MLDIYAKSFMTATRTDGIALRDYPVKNGKRLRWWQWPKTRYIKATDI